MLRKSIQLLILTLMPFALSAGEVPPMPEDCFPELRTILAGIDSTSPALQQGAASLDESEAGLKALRAARKPKISAFARVAGGYETRINSDYEDANKFSFGPYATIGTSIPVFHWGELKAKTDIASSRIHANEHWNEQRAAQIRQSIRRNYVEYQLAIQAADIARDCIAYAQRRQQGQKDLLENGLSSASDLLEADIFEQERQEELDQAKSTAASNFAQIQEATGKDNLEITPSPFPTLSLITDEELNALQQAASSAKLPQERAMEDELAAEKASFREMACRNRPKLDAVAATDIDSVDEYRNGNLTKVPRNNLWAGLQVNWTIYDSGAIEAEKMGSLARQRRIQARIDEAKLRQIREISDIARDAKLNASRFETRNRRLELLRKTVELMENQVMQKNIPANDLFQRKLDLQRTQLDLLRASAYYMLDISMLREIASYGRQQ